MIKISRNVLFSQSKGDILFVQVGYTAIHVKSFLGIDKCLRIELFAPSHNPLEGYSRTKFNISLVKPT